MYPLPGSKYTVPGTQIAFRGLPASSIGAISVVGSKSGAHPGRLVGDSDGQGGSFLPTKPFTAGETVTVATHLAIATAPKGTFSFKVSNPGNQLAAGARSPRSPPAPAACSTSARARTSSPPQ